MLEIRNKLYLTLRFTILNFVENTTYCQLRCSNWYLSKLIDDSSLFMFSLYQFNPLKVNSLLGKKHTLTHIILLTQFCLGVYALTWSFHASTHFPVTQGAVDEFRYWPIYPTKSLLNVKDSKHKKLAQREIIVPYFYSITYFICLYLIDFFVLFCTL